MENDSGFLYLAMPPKGERFKVGKTVDPLARWAALGIAPDPDQSMLIAGPLNLISRLEKTVLFLLRPWQAPLDRGLDGGTEWFKAIALGRAREHLTNILRTHGAFHKAAWPVRKPSGLAKGVTKTEVNQQRQAEWRKLINEELPKWHAFLDALDNLPATWSTRDGEFMANLHKLDQTTCEAVSELGRRAMHGIHLTTDAFGVRWLTNVETTQDAEAHRLCFRWNYRAVDVLLEKGRCLAGEQPALQAFKARLHNWTRS